MTKKRVTFLPDQIDMMVADGTSVLMAAAEAGLALEGTCGGKGTCGKCGVRLVDLHGPGTGPGRWVLGCQTAVDRDLVVEIPHEQVSLHRKSELTNIEQDFDLDPGISKVTLEVAPPSLNDQTSDADRLMRGLGDSQLEIKLDALRSLPGAIRQQNRLITAVLAERQVLAVEAGDTSRRLYGLAVDIGTTTVVAALVDLLTGETLAAASATNTQNIFGADVISRIEHVIQHPQGLEQLRRRVVQVINRLISGLTQTAGVLSSEIYQAVVVGNTTMSHLFLGLDPSGLAPAPFVPVTDRPLWVEAGSTGLNISLHGVAYVLPSIAGYVGGDTVGVILATGLDRQEGIGLALDIGTNGEIVLAAGGQLLACSTAAGPAFEGARIQCGMRAAEGAIEGVSIDDDVHLRVIGDDPFHAVPPQGLCGSGLMDAVAALVRRRLIDGSGRLVSREAAGNLPGSLQSRLSADAGGNYFILATAEETGKAPVVLTQKDVRELQLAKAAIRAGIQVLLDQAGVRVADIDQVLLAGAFGSYLNKTSALGIGLLPPIAPAKIRAVGNAAGAGALLALLSTGMRQRAEMAARRVKHVELSGRQDFQTHFLDALQFV